MRAMTRTAILVLAAFAVLFTPPPRSSVDAQTPTDDTPTPDVIVEAHTEDGGGNDDGDDSNDIAAFGAPSASPSKRGGESVYIQVTDLGPGDGDADPPEAGSTSTLFRFSVNAASDASGTFKSGGGTTLNCADNRSGCDLDSDNDDIIVQFDIADGAKASTSVVIDVTNVNDNKAVRVVINVTGPSPNPAPDAPAQPTAAGITSDAPERVDPGSRTEITVTVTDADVVRAGAQTVEVTQVAGSGVTRNGGPAVTKDGQHTFTYRAANRTDTAEFDIQVRANKADGTASTSGKSLASLALTIRVTGPASNPAPNAPAPNPPAPNPALDVTVEAYTESGGGNDDGDDSNDIAAFGAPSASPSKRGGDSVYIQVTDLGPGDGDADPPEDGSVATLFRFSVNSASTATGAFKSGGKTSLNCADGRRSCDLDSASDSIVVRFDIADGARANTSAVIDVNNVNDNKAVRLLIRVTGPASNPAPNAPAPNPAPDAPAPNPAPDVTVEAYTESGGGNDDGDDSNDIAAFSTPSASPEKRGGESVYIQVTDLGPGEGDADPPEAGSVSTLVRFSVNAASDASGAFKSGGRTTLNCADGRRSCDLDSASDSIVVRFDIADDAANNTSVVIDVNNVNDNKTVRVVIQVTGPAPDAPAPNPPPPPASPLPANFYGGGLTRSDVVTAMIGDAECGKAAADADGSWSIRVDEGGCGGRAVDGATVAFAVNGRVAGQTAVWRPGGQSRGIALTVAANAGALPASFYGGGLDAGDVVTASIDGAACGEAEAGAGGGWSILVEEGGCGGKAADGATIAFAIDGRAARPTATWRAGGLPDDREGGIALTAAGMTIGLRGARAVYVQDTDGGFDIHVVGAPDFVNARFGQRWIVAATPRTLTLDTEGVRAFYVQSADGAFDSHVAGAPDFVNAAFARRWIAGAIE